MFWEPNLKNREKNDDIDKSVNFSGTSRWGTAKYDRSMDVDRGYLDQAITKRQKRLS